MNADEQLFERYLRAHGYEYRFEPDDLPTRKLPDFEIWRGDHERVICEVTGFDPVAHPQPVLTPDAPGGFVTGPREEFGPTRRAIRDEARQLRDLAGRQPLVVVLTNVMGANVSFGLDNIAYAIDGDPRFTFLVNPETGEIAHQIYDPRNGKARDHLYLSAIVSVFASPLYQPHAVHEFPVRLQHWREHGETPCVDVLRLKHPTAVELPEGYFSGPFDRVRDYDRSGVT